jgi:hypothetical protein
MRLVGAAQHAPRLEPSDFSWLYTKLECPTMILGWEDDNQRAKFRRVAWPRVPGELSPS